METSEPELAQFKDDGAAYLQRLATEIAKENGVLLQAVNIDMRPEKEWDAMRQRETVLCHRLILTVECVVTSPQQALALRKIDGSGAEEDSK